jgi:ABC-type multidrug transport system fused ATPase/permease subunit
MNECLAGLPTIRAFGMGPTLIYRYREAADANTRAYFVFLVASRWLGVRLDTICLVFLTVMVFACVGAGPSFVAPGLVGLSVSMLMSLTGAFQWMVRQSAEVENNMVSVERVMDYTVLPVEDVDIAGDDRPSSSDTIISMPSSKHGKAAGPPAVVPADWPTRGEVVFHDVWMRYRPDLSPVLQGVTFALPPGHRVGVVSPSSTVVMAL